MRCNKDYLRTSFLPPGIFLCAVYPDMLDDRLPSAEQSDVVRYNATVRNLLKTVALCGHVSGL
ncbi:hypothetical protein DPMN_119491 [Dreissena polymorpha]|uniref:Uncharacterized protein n=1 Tax=Dreissena polymorpha TaxID=45954 RepID=A0A9D4GMJ0_DREPO|nr:hypothetical protein DPMN_119491 [Dreissena polymorpha]